jgi:hypothetical protein
LLEPQIVVVAEVLVDTTGHQVLVALVVLVFVLFPTQAITRPLLHLEQLLRQPLAETTSTHSLVLEPSLSNLFKEQSTWHISQK